MKQALPLVLIAVVAAIVLAVVGEWTAPRILENRESASKAQVRYVEKIIRTFLQESPILKQETSNCLNVPLVTIESESGYGGSLEVIIGFVGSELITVRAANHSETPGFAEVLEPDNWIAQFGKQPNDKIHVVTRSTITTNAVKRAVERAVRHTQSQVNSCLNT